MTYSEEVFTFGCGGEALLGILARPAQPHSVGVVVVVGGPQYRAGSHRQFVQLARALAEAGYPVLRFDVRGMGDATGTFAGFEGLSDDIGSAIDELHKRAPGLERVILWGLCDGASAALLYLDERGGDARVAGLCLANPWVRSPQTQARTQLKHYYARRLLDRAFWAKLLRGQVALGAAGELLRKVGTATRGALEAGAAQTVAMPFGQRMGRAWHRFDGRILLLLSGQDYTAKEFLQTLADDPHWRAADRHPGLERVDLPQADHTFSGRQATMAVQEQSASWMVAAESPLGGGALSTRADLSVEDTHATP
ncbi:MAG: hydrolase 1, exosortase A system-associated [Rubrivivax sp. SCN 70-15]|nr:MAG: hydrolase 1, exosortase A system-associated [Rubrivivax sp. SCN 70-15]